MGNVILKMYEGVGKTLLKAMKEAFMSSTRSKIGAALAKPALKETLKKFDTDQYGGAPLLGCNGLLVKTHGSSKSVSICNSILQCKLFADQNINDDIKEMFAISTDI